MPGQTERGRTTAMEELLEGLNEKQREAVTSTEGYIRVVAGAGSGKTRALSHRFAYLVNVIGVPPHNILCVTFTNRAANEMRQRIRTLIHDSDTGYISTFHSFCVSVLQEDSYAVQYPDSFLVLDNADIDSMLAQIYEERGLTLRDMTFKNARDMFEIRKCIEEPQYYRDMIAMPLDILRQKYLDAVDVKDILFYGYLYQQKKCFGLDYNDLINFTLYIFEINEEIRLKWQKRLEYIMIDEFQDIDALQYRLMEVLCGWHKNLFIVGDPDQTIYTWRGANVKYLLEFDKNFPGTKTIMMMENYRSTAPILAVANSLIARNTIRMKKDLIPAGDLLRQAEEAAGGAGLAGAGDAGGAGVSPVGGTSGSAAASGSALSGGAAGFGGAPSDGAAGSGEASPGPPRQEKPVWFHAKNAEEEAKFVADEIGRLKKAGVKPTDIAVLYRAHYVSRALEEVFLKEKLPYILYSGTQFYNRAEIKDAISYLRLIACHDDLSFARVVNTPKRNIGDKRMKFLREYAETHGCLLYDALKENVHLDLFRNTGARAFIELIDGYGARYADMQVSEILAQVLEESGYEEALRTEGSSERLDNLAELKQSIFEYETTCGEETGLTDYLWQIALFSNADLAGGKEAVKCMTVHTAKGLEFPYVFLCAMEEGVFPAKKTASREAMEEERRLAFVAVTRAEKGLYLSDSGGRNLDGSYRYPSRFLLDIDQKCLERRNEPEERFLRRAKEEIAWKEREMDVQRAPRFPAGTRVEHPVFGYGTVTEVREDEGVYLVRFDSLETERSIRFRAALMKVE